MDQLSESVGRAKARGRWLSRRAVLLHLTMLVVAAGCLGAGWWQATRALAGNGLSWFYSVEWPVFAIVAVVAWWHLVHEDPEQYRARRQVPRPSLEAAAPATDGSGASLTVDRPEALLATVLAVLVGVDSVLGVATVVFVPFSRPSGIMPAGAQGLYVLHAVLAAPMIVGAIALLLRCRNSSRLARLTGWVGGTGIALAGVGGLLTAAHPLRLAGMGLMLLGAAIAAFGYVMPSFEKLS